MTRLITQPVQQVFNRRQDGCARAALATGLAEYLKGVTLVAPGGREMRFAEVLDHYAEPNEEAAFPSAAVYASASAGKYDSSRLTPSQPNTRVQVPGTDLYAVTSCEYVHSLLLEVWASDDEGRNQLLAALEDVLNPSEGRYGFVLELDHYFNQRASYAAIDVLFPDDDVSAARRWRRAVLTVACSVPVDRKSVV